uniref:Uncharacterized protein n=1 Tax=Tetradesmus obliquus TaxID=3088 RepID=A0A383VZ43_TETOB|eukprot:jgi/Sobl393_1/11958/SZX70133.1
MIQVPALEHVVQPEHQPDGVCGSPNPLLRFVGADDAAEDVVQQALEVLGTRLSLQRQQAPDGHIVSAFASVAAAAAPAAAPAAAAAAARGSSASGLPAYRIPRLSAADSLQQLEAVLQDGGLCDDEGLELLEFSRGLLGEQQLAGPLQDPQQQQQQQMPPVVSLYRPACSVHATAKDLQDGSSSVEQGWGSITNGPARETAQQQQQQWQLQVHAPHQLQLQPAAGHGSFSSSTGLMPLQQRQQAAVQTVPRLSTQHGASDAAGSFAGGSAQTILSWQQVQCPRGDTPVSAGLTDAAGSRAGSSDGHGSYAQHSLLPGAGAAAAAAAAADGWPMLESCWSSNISLAAAG